MRSASISEIIRFASVISVAFPLMAYLLKFRAASRPIHLVGALVIASALSDVLALVYFSQGASTVFLFNVYYIVLFALLALFYHGIFEHKNTTTGGIIIFIVSFILITTFVQPFTEYQTFVWTIIGMIMVIFSISYFLHIFGLRSPMSNSSLLWINSGVLYYFSLNLFLFVMSSYVLTKMEAQISLLIWSFHNVNNILKNVLIGFGIAAFRRSSTETSTL
jgi:hypothetical protein